jgi:uncharacterized protein (DUF486 family)
MSHKMVQPVITSYMVVVPCEIIYLSSAIAVLVYVSALCIVHMVTVA